MYSVYSCDELSCSRCTIGTYMMNCQKDVLKDFDSRSEAMGLKCQYDNAEDINDYANV